MKTILKTLVVIALALISYGANAQWVETAQSVINGSTSKYKVPYQINHTYTWSVVNSDNSAIAGGVSTVCDITPSVVGAEAIATFSWKKSGTYKVIVTESVDATTCSTVSTAKFIVTVRDNGSVVDDWSTSLDVVNDKCPKEDFTISFQLKNAEYQAEVTFKFIDELGTDHGMTVKSDASGNFNLNITGFKVNTGNGDFTPTFELTKLVDKYGVSPTNFDAIKSTVITIHKNPTTLNILHD